MTTATAQPVLLRAAEPADSPLRAGDALPDDVFSAIRRRMLLHYCKWDPQVGDVSTLMPFPLLVSESSWRVLAATAEALAAETCAAESELLGRPDLHRTLALPWRLRRALAAVLRHGATPSSVRVMRFDFHWTTEGWRISEVNSDVPGGYAEASDFTALIAARCGAGLRPAGDPASRWADAIAGSVGREGHVALLAAPGFMEDQQVAATFARVLSARGLSPHLCDPSHVYWVDGRAHIRAAWQTGPLAAVVRFYQAEWLARLPRRCQWLEYFAGGRTPVTNPGSAVLTESKRFPLAWPHLKTSLPTWRRLLPESRDPRDARWHADDGWVLKTALSNTGDTVTARDWVPPKVWRSARRDVWLRPGQWVAQRRFETLAVPTPMGDLYPCVGVYTVNGRAAGAYVRAAPRPLVDYRAVDLALLVADDAAQRAEESA